MKSSNQFLFKNQCSEPFYRPPKRCEDLVTLLNAEFFDPLTDLEGYLCSGNIIIGNVYNIDTPFGTSDRQFYDFRRGVHSISRETGERQMTLKYLLQEMGKPFDLVAIPKECPEGKTLIT